MRVRAYTHLFSRSLTQHIHGNPGEAAPLDAARAAAGLEDVRLDDLRHSFASVTASGGGSLLLIGKLLGHKNTATTARYAHLLDDPVRAVADSAAESLAGWLSGRSR